MPKKREPFVSGSYRAGEDLSLRKPADLASIAREAHNKRAKELMRRRYSSRGTPMTRKITQRMIGEKDDD